MLYIIDLIIWKLDSLSNLTKIQTNINNFIVKELFNLWKGIRLPDNLFKKHFLFVLECVMPSLVEALQK